MQATDRVRVLCDRYKALRDRQVVGEAVPRNELQDLVDELASYDYAEWKKATLIIHNENDLINEKDKAELLLLTSIAMGISIGVGDKTHNLMDAITDALSFHKCLVDKYPALASVT